MKHYSTIAAVAVIVSFALAASADSLPGQVSKFQQYPLSAAPYYGHNEPSTAYSTFVSTPTGPAILDYRGDFVADDFADTVSTPVVHITWWGSYPSYSPNQPVDKFLIAFETDIPADVAPGGYSRPGDVLQWEVVNRGPLAPGSGTFTETPEPPGTSGPPLSEPLLRYNAELALPFPEQADTVYWLKIVALVDIDPTQTPETVWGWHNRDWSIPDPLASPAVTPGEFVQGLVTDPATGADALVWHFQDNAVGGKVRFDPSSPDVPVVQNIAGPLHYLGEDATGLPIDGPEGIEKYSEDLAFVLYTVPEPASATLLIAGVAALWRRRRR